MKSELDGVDHQAARAFAIANGVVGAGWGLVDAGEPDPLPDECGDIDRYLQHARTAFPGNDSMENSAHIFGTVMQPGDYCWMYESGTGEYWCCQIALGVDGRFRYRTGGAFDTADLHLTRNCTWALAGAADAVPGVVRRAFAGPFGVVSAIVTDAHEAVLAAEIALGLNQPAVNGNLFAIATPEDMEDLVALYLQFQGWMLFPSTAKRSMANYEFIFVHRDDGRRAGVQVKSGAQAFLDPQVAEEFAEYFVFMANPAAIVARGDARVQQIQRDVLETFARNNWYLLPQRLQNRWPIA